MEFFKRLAERLSGRGKKAEPTRAQGAQAPSEQEPVERILPQRGPETGQKSTRLWAERAEFAFAKGEELQARGTRAQEAVADDPLERLTLLCRRCASDIAAQDDLR